MTSVHSFRFRLGAAFVALALTDSAGAMPLGIDQAAPALVVKTLGGANLDLSQLHGRVVVLNLWASWCPPCRAEMPLLEAFYRRHASEGVLVIGVSADDPHDRRDVVRAMRGLSFPAAMLADAQLNGFGDPPAVPLTFVIDGDGVIRARLDPGRQAVTTEMLESLVRPLLTPASQQH